MVWLGGWGWNWVYGWDLGYGSPKGCFGGGVLRKNCCGDLKDGVVGGYGFLGE